MQKNTNQNSIRSDPFTPIHRVPKFRPPVVKNPAQPSKPKESAPSKERVERIKQEQSFIRSSSRRGGGGSQASPTIPSAPIPQVETQTISEPEKPQQIQSRQISQPNISDEQKQIQQLQRTRDFQRTREVFASQPREQDPVKDFIRGVGRTGEQFIVEPIKGAVEFTKRISHAPAGTMTPRPQDRLTLEQELQLKKSKQELLKPLSTQEQAFLFSVATAPVASVRLGRLALAGVLSADIGLTTKKAISSDAGFTFETAGEVVSKGAIAGLLLRSGKSDSIPTGRVTDEGIVVSGTGLRKRTITRDAPIQEAPDLVQFDRGTSYKYNIKTESGQILPVRVTISKAGVVTQTINKPTETIRIIQKPNDSKAQLQTINKKTGKTQTKNIARLEELESQPLISRTQTKNNEFFVKTDAMIIETDKKTAISTFVDSLKGEVRVERSKVVKTEVSPIISQKKDLVLIEKPTERRFIGGVRTDAQIKPQKIDLTDKSNIRFENLKTRLDKGSVLDTFTQELQFTPRARQKITESFDVRGFLRAPDEVATQRGIGLFKDKTGQISQTFKPRVQEINTQRITRSKGLIDTNLNLKTITNFSLKPRTNRFAIISPLIDTKNQPKLDFKLNLNQEFKINQKPTQKTNLINDLLFDTDTPKPNKFPSVLDTSFNINPKPTNINKKDPVVDLDIFNLDTGVFIPFNKRESKKQDAYDVFVFDNGKKKRINREPKTKQQAFNYGAGIVSDYANTKFELKKRPDKIKSRNVSKNTQFKQQFSKKGNVYTEKKQFQKETFFERKGINFEVFKF